MKNWWHLDIAETARVLKTDVTSGLPESQIKPRLAEYGPNKLREEKGRSALKIFLDQFEDFIIWVLIGAALVSGFLQEWVDALAIIAIIILNAVLGLIQEYRAEKSLLALKKMARPVPSRPRRRSRVDPLGGARPRRPDRARSRRSCPRRQPSRLAYAQLRRPGSEPDRRIHARH